MPDTDVPVGMLASVGRCFFHRSGRNLPSNKQKEVNKVNKGGTRSYKDQALGIQVPCEKVFGVGARRVQVPSEKVRLDP